MQSSSIAMYGSKVCDACRQDGVEVYCMPHASTTVYGGKVYNHCKGWMFAKIYEKCKKGVM